MGTTADYDAEYTFIRHVMLPNAKRPTHDPGHPLYTNFYQEDVLLLLRQVSISDPGIYTSRACSLKHLTKTKCDTV